MTAAKQTASDSSTVKYITAASMIDCTGLAASKDPVPPPCADAAGMVTLA